MSTGLVTLIRKANQDFSAFLDEFSRYKLDDYASADVSKRIQRIAAEIGQVGDTLQAQSLPAQLDVESRAEMDRYTGNLEQLKKALERIRLALLERQSQLKSAQAHIRAASSWMESYKKTT